MTSITIDTFATFCKITIHIQYLMRTTTFDPKAYIRTVPNWPIEGVQFRDITTLLGDKEGFRLMIDALADRYRGLDIDTIVGLDARGFIIGAPLAYLLDCKFVPIRKKGKLPFETIGETYELEYGQATVEMHTDALSKESKVLLVDDLIATGGTLLAAQKLIASFDAEIVEACAVIDLPDLGGSNKLREAGLKVYALCEYEGE